MRGGGIGSVFTMTYTSSYDMKFVLEASGGTAWEERDSTRKSKTNAVCKLRKQEGYRYSVLSSFSRCSIPLICDIIPSENYWGWPGSDGQGYHSGN